MVSPVISTPFMSGRGKKEAGDTELFHKLQNKLGAVLGFNNGIPGATLSVLHEELQRLQREEGLALVHASR